MLKYKFKSIVLEFKSPVFFVFFFWFQNFIKLWWHFLYAPKLDILFLSCLINETLSNIHFFLKEYKPKGIIPTEDIMAVAMLTDEHKPNHFAFFTPNKNYHLRADTISDAESWVSQLKKTVDAASESNLSSSFKRIGVLESAAQQQDAKASSSYRHSFIPSSDHLIRKGHCHTFSEGEPKISTTTNNSEDFKTRLNFSKRHSINILDPSKLQKGVPGYNNGQSFSKEEVSTSKLSKSFGSTTSPGSSRSEYLSSIMSTTDDVQSSLASTHTEELVVDKAAPTIPTIPTTSNIPDPSIQPEQNTTKLPASNENKDTTINDSNTITVTTASNNNNTIIPTANTNEQSALEPSMSPLDENHLVNDDDEDKEIPLTHIDQENIIETGYLHKRKKRYNQWKKLWVVLTNQRILLFKNDKVRMFYFYFYMNPILTLFFINSEQKPYKDLRYANHCRCSRNGCIFKT